MLVLINKGWLALVAAAWLVLTSTACIAGTPVLILNDTNEPPFTTADGNGFIDVVAREAFRRAGVQLTLVKLPAERGLINANSGIEDGEISRIAGIDSQYPNLIRVPEKLIDWEFSAFSKQGTLPARLEQLSRQPIGHIRGWKIYEKQLVGAPMVVSADDASQLFKLLQLGRIDVALYERSMGISLLQRQVIKGVDALDPPLATREMFIYLHKRHADRVPKIAEALRAIKAEGLYDKLYREKVLSLREPLRK